MANNLFLGRQCAELSKEIRRRRIFEFSRGGKEGHMMHQLNRLLRRLTGALKARLKSPQKFTCVNGNLPNLNLDH